MKKIAVFTEGISELAFVHRLLFLLLNPQDFSVQCLALRGGKQQFYDRAYRGADPQVHFQLVDVGGDERVVSVILERESGLIKNGFDAIVGLRDMLSDQYCNRSRQIDPRVIETFVKQHENSIRTAQNPDKIHICWAIMEYEAWLLSMYGLFPKINPKLTSEFILHKLGHNLKTLDPENYFFHPADIVDQIFILFDDRYKKTTEQAETIARKIDVTDLTNATENHRCARLVAFLDQMRALAQYSSTS